MNQLIIILFCLIFGYALIRTRALASGAGGVLGQVVIRFSLPGMILLQVPKLEIGPDPILWIGASMPWVLVLGAWALLGKALAPWLERRGWTRGEIGAAVLMAGLGNTSFVGLPLLEAIVGPQVLPFATFLDQAGSFLALAILAPWIVATYGPQNLTARPNAFAQVLRFPPFQALCVALLASALSRSLGGAPFFEIAPAWLEPSIARIAATLVPISLLSVGMRLAETRPSAQAGSTSARVALTREQVSVALTYKMLLAPAAYALALSGVWALADGTRIDPDYLERVRVIVLESAMAPMITAGVVASESGLSERIPALALSIGIPLSLVSVPLWNLLLQRLW